MIKIKNINLHNILKNFLAIKELPFSFFFLEAETTF